MNAAGPIGTLALPSPPQDGCVKTFIRWVVVSQPMRGRAFLFLLAFLGTTLSGCLDGLGTDKDVKIDVSVSVSIDRTPPPEVAIPNPIRTLKHVARALDDGGNPVPTSGGMDVYGHFAYMPGQRTGFFVVNISNPEKPVIVGKLGQNLDTGNASILIRFVTIVDLGDRLIAVGAGQGSGMHFIDVSDPLHLRLLTTLQMPLRQPVHNVIKLPGTTLVYNTPSTGMGGTNHIVDLADPETPQIVGAFGDHGCHLTDVRMDLRRAYCAGVQESQIWDITDPVRPVLIARVDHPLIGNGGLHHQALPNWNGKILMITDEWRGGGSPGSCSVSQNTPAGTVSPPLGSLWFFDTSDEKAPQMLSWFTPPYAGARTNTVATPPAAEPLPNCTGHIGVLVPGREQIVVAWYMSGVVLVDFKDPSKPYMVHRWNEGTNTWNVKVHQGWMFTGDIARGMDVLRFE